MNPINLKSLKWSRRLVWRIFDLMISNSWLIFWKINDFDQMSLFDFKFHIAQAFLNGAIPTTQIPFPINQQKEEMAFDEDEPHKKKLRVYLGSVPDESRLDRSNHFPIFTAKSERCHRSIAVQQRVVACNQLSQWECSKCRVHLCLSSERNCFLLYHTQ